VYASRREWAQGKGEGGYIWWIYFISLYENRRMKPITTVLKRGGGGKRENNGSYISSTKMHCEHICNYHNVSRI
jgi:hypothetical protein